MAIDTDEGKARSLGIRRGARSTATQVSYWLMRDGKRHTYAARKLRDGAVLLIDGKEKKRRQTSSEEARRRAFSWASLEARREYQLALKLVIKKAEQAARKAGSVAKRSSRSLKVFASGSGKARKEVALVGAQDQVVVISCSVNRSGGTSMRVTSTRVAKGEAKDLVARKAEALKKRGFSPIQVDARRRKILLDRASRSAS